MASIALNKFNSMSIGASVLKGQAGSVSLATQDQVFIDQTVRKAAIAFAVGCWEGYIEAAIREFVSKVRVQTNRKSWSLIAQFEVMVDKKASSLNTPNWEQTRNFLIEVTGMDPYSSWVWAPTFSNQIDTKSFFDGIMSVRHAFAHGFSIPAGIVGPATPGMLDGGYVDDAIRCIEFFASKTDELLEYELMHRHGCLAGWS